MTKGTPRQRKMTPPTADEPAPRPVVPALAKPVFHSLKGGESYSLDAERENRFAELKAAMDAYLIDFPDDHARVAALGSGAAATGPEPVNRLADAEPWADRANRAETPVDFVWRVLGGDLTGVSRADLRAQKGLYQAYTSWVFRNKNDPLNLPTRATRTTSRIEKMDHEQLREAAKLYAAMQMRKRRKQSS